MKQNEPTRFGLIGRKLSHSFSRKYFSHKFEQEAIHAEYHLHELASIEELPDLVKEIPNLRGLNVTIPYKEQVIPYLTELSPAAKSIGAVNTIRVSPEGLYGDNSDIYGFWQSLKELLKGEVITHALILGTGGAAKAVEYVLNQQLKVKDYRLVSRSPQGDLQIGYDQLSDWDWDSYRLIINTTPLGMYPKIEAAPGLPYERFTPQHFAYDLVYNPQTTHFMQLAAEQGSAVMNGMQMLILQAEKSWEIWHQ